MGRFIVIEGLDGSGKTTQSRMLKDYLVSKGAKVKGLSFPNYDKPGCTLVNMYLGGQLGNDPDSTNAYAASMFYAADRYTSYVTDWRASVSDPECIVLSTRYTTANAYHQLSKLPADRWDEFLDWLYDFEFCKLGLPKPDDVVLLSMPPEVSAAQVESRCRDTGEKKDIHELDRDYLERCAVAAEYAADKGGWSVINCAPEGRLLPREKILELIIEALKL